MQPIAAGEVILQVANGAQVCSLDIENNKVQELKHVSIGTIIHMLLNKRFRFFINYSKDEEE